MITRNGEESEIKNLEILLKSIIPYVSEVCITVTTKKDEEIKPEYLTFLRSFGCKVSSFVWCDDFSKARSFNFSQSSHELILWIDADDQVENPQELPSLRKRFEKNKSLTSIWLSYDYDYDQDGNVAMKVPRERIVRKSIHNWVGRLHENLICKYLPIVDIVDESICKLKHNIEPDEISEKAFRNLKIIEQAFTKEKADNAVDPRTVFDLGRSYHALGDLGNAKLAFVRFLEITDSNSDMYHVFCRMSDIAKAQKNLNESRDYALQAVKLKHSWPDAYHCLAYVSFIEERYPEVIHWLKIADKLEPPKGVLPYDPTKYKIRPLCLAQDCYFRMNMPKEALVCAKNALKLSPSSEPLKSAVNMIENFLHDQKIEMSWVSVLSELEKENRIDDMAKLLECAPSSMNDHPFLIQMRNSLKKGSVKNRVVIYCHEAYEDWSPESIKDGIGGSEEAVINISKNLSKLGWVVDVYCNCSNSGNHEGVNWYQFYEYDRNVDCDVFIAWRMNEYISLAPESSYKILWLHDKQKLDYYSESLISKIDKIFVLSEYHRKDLKELPDDKFYITRNGIDPNHFLPVPPVNNYKNRYIFASSPDRGLHKILDRWLEIKAINPKAELHIFYGFNKTYDKIQEQDTRRKEFKERILRQVKELPDIVWHGRVGHKEIADWFMKCGFWLYPCTFDEISCITAMKAQAAGCWPIANDFAALAETVQHGTITKGSVEDSGIMDKWVESVGRASEEATPDARLCMRQWALNKFSWEALAQEWSEEFKAWKKK